MDEAAAVRRTALESVRDVAPPRLRDDIEGFVTAGSLVPGVLTILAAELSDGDAPDGVAERAAGVQLIYDGLRLTRRLANDDPWATGDAAAANLDILAADVLVARGFYLLARTEAAEEAVEVVRSFGRDQTARREEDRPAFDRNLEEDVLHLAIVAGVSAAGDVPAETAALVTDIAGAWDEGFPAPEGVFDQRTRDRLAIVAGSGGRPLNRND